MAAKRKEDFIVTMHNMIFVFASKEKGLISPLCNTAEVTVFNFYFSLRHRIFHERVIPLYCFRNFIKNTTRCPMFCFRARFTRTKIKPFRIFSAFCLLRRRNIMSVISPCRRFSAWILDRRSFEKYRVVWSREANVKGRLIN